MSTMLMLAIWLGGNQDVTPSFCNLASKMMQGKVVGVCLGVGDCVT